MSWNYRIVKTTYAWRSSYDEGFYDIKEVYYDESGKPESFTEEEVSPSGYSEEGIRKSFELYKKAFEKPVLYYNPTDCKFYEIINNQPVECKGNNY